MGVGGGDAVVVVGPARLGASSPTPAKTLRIIVKKRGVRMGLKILRIRDNNGEKYLTRVVLFRCSRLKVYLHKIHQSDHDRALHDHPWPFISLLLWGSYQEDTHPEPKPGIFNTRIRLRRRIRFLNIRLRPDAPHRLELDRGKVYTLVFGGRKVREWGFWTDEGFVHHREYLGEEAITSDYD